MLFTHDTELALIETAALVNSLGLRAEDEDTLVTEADFEVFFARNPYSGEIRRTADANSAKLGVTGSK